MAIPGYINTSQTGYTDTEYYKELSPLVGILGHSITDVVAFVKTLINDIDVNIAMITSDESGVLDLTNVRTATTQSAIAKNIRVVSAGGLSQAWPLGFWGYYNGFLYAYFGDAADDAAKTWSTTVTSQLQTPKIFASRFQVNLGGFNPEEWLIGFNYVEIQFVATYNTRWGETPASDPLYKIVEYKANSSPSWEITLEVEEPIPSYVKSVRYYRFKDDTFYLLQEVEV
jgi:hypothetical protein